MADAPEFSASDLFTQAPAPSARRAPFTASSVIPWQPLKRTAFALGGAGVSLVLARLAFPDLSVVAAGGVGALAGALVVAVGIRFGIRWAGVAGATIAVAAFGWSHLGALLPAVFAAVAIATVAVRAVARARAVAAK